MIRINLLDQKKTAASAGPQFDWGGKGLQAAIWVGILFLGLAWVGWNWFSLGNQIETLQEKITTADLELKELEAAIATVDERQANKDALEQRVVLISELKRRQSVPVHLLDQISRELPEFLWLEGVAEKDGSIEVHGKATTYNAVSNFYNNLKNSGFFSDVTLGTTQTVPEGVSFRLSCHFAPPVAAGSVQAVEEESETAETAEAARG